MKKILFPILIVLLLFAGCMEITNSDEGQEKEQTQTEEKQQVKEEKDKKTDLKTEAEANAVEHPAKPGKKLFGEEFLGMPYYFKGKLVKKELVEGVFDEAEKALLVKNENNFILVIFPPYEIEAAEGDEIEAWGHLSGDGYASSDLNINNVVGVTGGLNASIINVNGEQK